jgi:hypothetical protein
LQHDRQFLAPHVAHAHSVSSRSIVTEGADHVDRELVFPAQQMVIEFPAEGILIAGGQVLDLAVPQDCVEGKGFQLLADLGRIDIQRLDLSLDVLLLVCQELVDLAIALNVACSRSRNAPKPLRSFAVVPLGQPRIPTTEER